jgi:hypothetical protein
VGAELAQRRSYFIPSGCFFSVDSPDNKAPQGSMGSPAAMRLNSQ